MRAGGWVGLVAVGWLAVQGVGGAGRMLGERMDCQEALRRSRWGGEAEGALRQLEPLTEDVVEAVCREEYFARRDPDDGVALGRVLVERGELRGAAAVGQGLLLTRARADALVLLGVVAERERTFDEAARNFGMAGELYERQERWGEAGAARRRQAVLLRGTGRAAEAAAAEAAAQRLSITAGKGAGGRGGEGAAGGAEGWLAVPAAVE